MNKNFSCVWVFVNCFGCWDIWKQGCGSESWKRLNFCGSRKKRKRTWKHLTFWGAGSGSIFHKTWCFCFL